MLKHLRVFIFMILVLFQVIVFGTFFTIVNGFNSKFHQYQKKYMYIIYLYILNCKINVNNKVGYDDTKKYIIMSNHYTALDYFALNTIFPNSLTVVKNDLLSQRNDSNLSVNLVNRVSYLFFKIGMLITYIRGNAKSGEDCKKNIIKNIPYHNIILFPEGTSSKEGIPKKFKNGIFHLCKDKHIPVLLCSLKYDKNIGVNPNGKFQLTDWVDTTLNINVLSEVNPPEFESVEKLVNYSFNTIVNEL